MTTKDEIKIDFEELAKEAIFNVRKDRKKTQELLHDLIGYTAGGADRHKEVGFTLAKYLETLQRSNEQLVKLLPLIKEKDDPFKSEISNQERESIFEQLNDVAKKNAKSIKK